MFARVEKKSLNPVDKHVGGRVRMRRLMLAMSQEKLGDALGLTFQQVQKYEKGTNRIGAGRLHQISHILQVPVAFFFEGAPNLHGSTDRMKEAPFLSVAARQPKKTFSLNAPVAIGHGDRGLAPHRRL